MAAPVPPTRRWIPTRCYDDGPCDEYEGPEEEDLDAIRTLEEDLETIWRCHAIGRDMLEDADSCAETLLTIAERPHLRVPEIIHWHTDARALLTSLMNWQCAPTFANRIDLQQCLSKMPRKWISIPLCEAAKTALRG